MALAASFLSHLLTPNYRIGEIPAGFEYQCLRMLKNALMTVFEGYYCRDKHDSDLKTVNL